MAQLLGAPASTQQRIAVFWEAERVEPCGIDPLATEALMEVLALNIWEYVVSAPGPLVLPEAWQPEFVAQEALITGATSPVNVLVVEQSGVVGVVVELLLLLEHDTIARLMQKALIEKK